MYHSLFTYHTFRLFPVFHYCKELQWTQYLYKYWHTWAKISGGWFPTNGITGSICKITRTLYDFPKRLIYTNTLIHLYSHQARIRVTIIQKKRMLVIQMRSWPAHHPVCSFDSVLTHCFMWVYCIRSRDQQVSGYIAQGRPLLLATATQHGPRIHSFNEYFF